MSRLLEIFKADSETVPKTFWYKLRNNLATIDDQEEALTKPEYAYRFIRNVPGADIRKCEEAACKAPGWAYYFALNIPGADIRKCEEAAYNHPYWAYCFFRYIPEADKEKYLKAAKR